jgi:hypothetical protein
VIVRLEADGAVVADADDCSAVRVESALDRDDLQTALAATGTGTVPQPRPGDGSAGHGAGHDVVLDLAVLRSRAQLVASGPDWAERFDAMVAASGERLTDDGLGLRVPVERPARS